MVYCLFEDNVHDFQPLVHLRPIFDLTCGILTLRQKWERAVRVKPLRTAVRDELHEFRIRPERLAPGGPDLPDGVWLINGRFFPDPELRAMIQKEPRGARILTSGDSVVAAYLRSGDLTDAFPARAGGLPDFTHLSGIVREEVQARALSGFWDLVRLNGTEISSDRDLLKKELRPVKPKNHPGAHFVKGMGISVGKRSVIKPGVVIDAENGPVVIGSDVTIMPNAVILGPAVIGNGATIKVGAKIYGGTTIGERCKVGGEVEASVLLPCSNKQHEGFLGHSYLASWVNLGADTNTSDLKNTYGPVSIVRRGKKVDTGMQFLGLTMGDHSKSGINVMFDTGTVVGVCCNVFGAGIPPKEIPSFSWGGAGSLTGYDPEKGFDVMKVVMARRNVRPAEEYARTVRELFARTATDREIAGIR